MNNEDLDRLEKLARGATPGPWQPAAESGDWFVMDSDYEKYVPVTDHDAIYIANAHPTTVLKLIELARAAIRMRDGLEEIGNEKLHPKLMLPSESEIYEDRNKRIETARTLLEQTKGAFE